MNPYTFDVETTPDGDRLLSMVVVTYSSQRPPIEMPGFRIIAAHYAIEPFVDYVRRTRLFGPRKYLWVLELLESS